MKGFPQLRVRTEYSFRSCYGPVARVAERLEEIGCPAAGIVDTSGTWGHVDWERHVPNPMFGAELVFERGALKPRAWVLAEDLAAFYRLTSNPPQDPSEMASAAGVIRFAGAALTDPETFDYIDVNPRSRRRTRQALALARHTGKPLVVTSDNDYPGPEDRDRFLAWDDSLKMTPQYLLTEQELRRALPDLDDETFRSAVRNCHEVAERLQGIKLRKAPLISVPGDIRELVEAGRQYRLERGHIAEWTEEYQARLERELALIHEKQFESYFIVVADMVTWAKERMLVGPARGSSAGSLVCYLLRITEVDPIVHGLLFERFIDVNRADLPDIDIDFNDQKRELVFDYLRERYGHEHVARIGSINRLKARSVVAHVGKKLGIPHGAAFGMLNVLLEYSSGDSRYGKGLEDTINGTKPGQDFIARYPEAALMGELELHASHTGQHAAGIIVSNEPVLEYCTVRDGIAQVDKEAAEYLNLLKIDALGLRTLGVIEDAGCVTPQQLYDLTLDDPRVFDVVNSGKFSGVFQFEGASQRRVARQIEVKSFRELDHITALARPGPLGGGATGSYIERTAGREPITYKHPSMAEYLADTQGVVVYQEQVMRIVRELGKFSWEKTSVIRKAMSGRKGAEFFNRLGEEFVAGAAESGLSAADAKELWDSLIHMGAWSMNRSHTVSYAIISYWCAYMKAYHPLEYAAACLRHAKDDTQVVELLRELDQEGIPFTPFDPDASEVNWSVKDGKLLGGFSILRGIGPVKAAAYLAKREAGQLTDDDRAKLAALPPKIDDLYPGRTMWGEMYDHPERFNINGRVKLIAELEDQENAVIICRLVRLVRRDHNEAMQLAKRGYALNGQTLFLDAFVVDDSVAQPVSLRIRSSDWHRIGEPMADKAKPGDWFLVRGKWLQQFSMMSAIKVKCLTNPEMFS